MHVGVLKAFSNAWKAACSSSQGSVLVVPKNKNYLLKPITFEGPCKSSIAVQVRFFDRVVIFFVPSSSCFYFMYI